MQSLYNPEYIQKYFDDYGEKEWFRLEKDLHAVMSFEVHRRMLLEYVKDRDYVFEIGAGAGRYTIELGKLGAKTLVGDISQIQLDINMANAIKYGVNDSIEDWVKCDITNLEGIPEAAFDVSIAYGGVISYVFDKADAAIDELIRVTKPGGYILLSVMSLLGTTRSSFEGVLTLYNKHGSDAISAVNETGNLIGPIAESGHYCKMYRWSELASLLKDHGLEVVDKAASDYLITRDNEHYITELVSRNRRLWADILTWEWDFCREDGAIDGGTHIIAVVKR